MQPSKMQFTDMEAILPQMRELCIIYPLYAMGSMLQQEELTW